MFETTESWFGREGAQKLHKPTIFATRVVSANIGARDLISLHVPLACVLYISMYVIGLCVPCSMYARMPVCKYVPHSLYAGMPVSKCVACQPVCDCMPGTAWPAGAVGQSGLPEHPPIRPLSSMLELVPVLTFIILILLSRTYSQLVTWSCKMPSRLTHVVIIDSLDHYEEFSFLQSCFVNVGVGESVGGGG